jgi:hypothetical protein
LLVSTAGLVSNSAGLFAFIRKLQPLPRTHPLIHESHREKFGVDS